MSVLAVFAGASGCVAQFRFSEVLPTGRPCFSQTAFPVGIPRNDMIKAENCANVPAGIGFSIPKEICSGILAAPAVLVSAWLAPFPAVTLVLFSPGLSRRGESWP
jgi:hypothetical protein